MAYDESLHGKAALAAAKFEKVTIPDMFVSFAAKAPRKNPLLDQANTESMVWISNIGADELGDRNVYHRIRTVNYSYWAAIIVPDAPYEYLRTFIDWCNIFFLFDDLFDVGELKTNKEETVDMIKDFMAIMRGEERNKPKHPWVKVHDSVWTRIKAGSCKVLAQRYADACDLYSQSVLQQVEVNVDNQLSTVDERLLRTRMGSGAAKIAFNLAQYALGLTLPPEVYADPSFLKLEDICSDILVLQNDAVSYVKEQTEGINNNIVTICRVRGMSAQEAFDHIDERLHACYREWYLTLADMPVWGETIDAQVLKYVEALSNGVVATLHASFGGKRYFGEHSDEVRRTRIISVYPDEFYVEARQAFNARLARTGTADGETNGVNGAADAHATNGTNGAGDVHVANGTNGTADAQAANGTNGTNGVEDVNRTQDATAAVDADGAVVTNGANDMNAVTNGSKTAGAQITGMQATHGETNGTKEVVADTNGAVAPVDTQETKEALLDVNGTTMNTNGTKSVNEILAQA